MSSLPLVALRVNAPTERPWRSRRSPSAVAASRRGTRSVPRRGVEAALGYGSGLIGTPTRQYEDSATFALVSSVDWLAPSDEGGPSCLPFPSDREPFRSPSWRWLWSR